MSILLNSLALSHKYLKESIHEGDTVIDATCGNGNDTLFLSKLVCHSGKVFSFDIQGMAIGNVSQILNKKGITNVTLICDGHENFDRYKFNNISAITYNLGYLPGGDKKITTNFHTTLMSIKKALSILKKGGILTIVLYTGIESGKIEYERMIEFCNLLDQKKYCVLLHRYLNQVNNPPELICIEKL